MVKKRSVGTLLVYQRTQEIEVLQDRTTKIFRTGPTGCNSDIWKKVQVNIYCIYIGSTETNDTSAESP